MGGVKGPFWVSNLTHNFSTISTLKSQLCNHILSQWEFKFLILCSIIDFTYMMLTPDIYSFPGTFSERSYSCVKICLCIYYSSYFISIYSSNNKIPVSKFIFQIYILFQKCSDILLKTWSL